MKNLHHLIESKGLIKTWLQNSMREEGLGLSSRTFYKYLDNPSKAPDLWIDKMSELLEIDIKQYLKEK